MRAHREEQQAFVRGGEVSDCGYQARMAAMGPSHAVLRGGSGREPAGC